MKKLLITGASGVFGRSLAKNSVSKYEVIGLCHSHDYKPENFKLKHLDLTNFSEIEDCLDDVRPSVVVHTAGLSDIQECEADSEAAESVNYRATAQLAAFCAQRAIRLIYLSTDMVFDGEAGNYKEDDKTNPLNQYGKTKFAAEEAVRSISQNSVIARLNLIYGHGEAVKKTFTDRILIANWSQKTYGIFADQVRSPISLNQAANVITEFIDGDQTGVFHIGGAEQINRWDFALKLVSYLKLDPSIVEKVEIPEELKGLYPVNTSFDTSKAQKDLKTELANIEEGLKNEYGKYVN